MHPVFICDGTKELNELCGIEVTVDAMIIVRSRERLHTRVSHSSDTLEGFELKTWRRTVEMLFMGFFGTADDVVFVIMAVLTLTSRL